MIVRYELLVNCRGWLSLYSSALVYLLVQILQHCVVYWLGKFYDFDYLYQAQYLSDGLIKVASQELYQAIDCISALL